MIAGVGTDILKIDRLVASYQRTRGRLAERILGPDEMLVFKAIESLDLDSRTAVLDKASNYGLA